MGEILTPTPDLWQAGARGNWWLRDGSENRTLQAEPEALGALLATAPAGSHDRSRQNAGFALDFAYER
jgi:hypothetical protein